MPLTWPLALVGFVALVLSEAWRQASPVPVRESPLTQACAMALAMSTAWPVAGGLGDLRGLFGPLLLAAGAVLLVALWYRRVRAVPQGLLRLATSVVVAGLLVRVPGPNGTTLLERIEHPEGDTALFALTLLAAAVLAAAAPIVARGVQAALRRHAWPWATLLAELGRQAPVSLAAASTAVVMSLALTELGAASLVLFQVPLLVLQPAVARQRRIRQAQRQTVFALARLPEEAGFAAAGHGARVAALAVPIARDLGVEPSDLADVEAAALLHDIGQVGLDRPVPDGATVEVSGRDQRQIAATGSSILARTAELSRLSTLVADVGLAQHRAVERGDVSLTSRVVRVASAYDDLTGRATRLAGAAGPVHALERILRTTPHEYDPVVVAALIRQLERRGALSAAQAATLRD
ncbi:putative lipoprotein [Serinicoccus hydrothermalis]|uniref:Putative lipoprotein n=1 Tax=Serinicoccus hydrothermalis TaxID=1758689 RepID=A0A1B1NGB4_9MICO|nr:HD domain-containing phosphohydrolase [Serinicoccus hydrothermalis]ANS80443.1 putative lipoprotein [Serinicoccus hydrothermalis]